MAGAARQDADPSQANDPPSEWVEIRVSKATASEGGGDEGIPAAYWVIGTALVALGALGALSELWVANEYFLTEGALWKVVSAWLTEGLEVAVGPDGRVDNAEWNRVTLWWNSTYLASSMSWVAELIVFFLAAVSWKSYRPHAKGRVVVLGLGFVGSAVMVGWLRGSTMLLVSLTPSAEDSCASYLLPVTVLCAWFITVVQQLVFFGSLVHDSMEAVSKPGSRLLLRAVVLIMTILTAYFAWIILVFLVRQPDGWVVPATAAVSGTTVLGIAGGLTFAMYCSHDAAEARAGCSEGLAYSCTGACPCCCCCCTPRHFRRRSRRKRRATTVNNILHSILAIVAIGVVFEAQRPSGPGTYKCPTWMSPARGNTHPPPAGVTYPFGLDATLPENRILVLDQLTSQGFLLYINGAVVVVLCCSFVLDSQNEVAQHRKRRAETSAAALGRAIAYVSHEARGPLNAAALGLALLETGDGTDPDDVALLDDVGTSVQAARRHLDDLLLGFVTVRCSCSH